MSTSIATPDPILATLSELGIPAWSAAHPQAGLNAFIGMCNALCVLEGPDAHLVDPKANFRLPVGVDLLSLDPATNRLIYEIVLRPVHHLQSVWLRRVNATTARARRDAFIRQSQRADGWDLIEKAKRSSDVPLHQLDSQSDHGMLPDLFDEKLHIQKELAYTSPRIITGSISPKDLGRDLGDAHLGHLLVAPQFSNLMEVEAADPVLNAAMSGSFNSTRDEAFSIATGGRIIATVTPLVAAVLYNHDLCAAIWPSRVMELPMTLHWDRTDNAYPPAATSLNLIEAYGSAVRQVLNNRLLAIHQAPPHAPGLHALHRKLMHEIRRIPGIDPSLVEQSAALFATLYRGVALMVTAAGTPWPASLRDEQLKTLTLLIVTNAARQLAARRQNAIIAQKRESALSLYEKLSDEPISVRDLSRSFHRRTSLSCLEILHWLQSLGVVAREGKKWRIARADEADARRLIKTSDLIIDVPAA